MHIISLIRDMLLTCTYIRSDFGPFQTLCFIHVGLSSHDLHTQCTAVLSHSVANVPDTIYYYEDFFSSRFWMKFEWTSMLRQHGKTRASFQRIRQKCNFSPLVVVVCLLAGGCWPNNHSLFSFLSSQQTPVGNFRLWSCKMLRSVCQPFTNVHLPSGA